MNDYAFEGRCSVSYIYALHAGDEVSRYVGSANNPSLRWYGHRHAWELPEKLGNKQFAAWLASLKEPPQMKILAVVPRRERWITEGEWIRTLRTQGHDLVNVTNHPSRAKPCKQGITPEGRERIAEASRRRWAKWRTGRMAVTQ